MALRNIASKSFNLRTSAAMSNIWRMMSSEQGELGSGAGKGGGGGGSIRDAGGSFGKREAAQEEQYFRKLQQEQLSKMKEHIEDQIEEHERELKHHEEAMDHHKKRIKELRNKHGKN
ncbi:hypothetical protein CHUAL_000806 [Chamberlinius hualienensis]